MSEETFVAYITKYAMTQGIYAVRARRCSANGMIEQVTRTSGVASYYLGEGRDWHLTWESALAKAEDMRKRKIQSLQKSILKMSALKFSRPIAVEEKP